jgi:hypothetical protein
MHIYSPAPGVCQLSAVLSSGRLPVPETLISGGSEAEFVDQLSDAWVGRDQTVKGWVDGAIANRRSARSSARSPSMSRLSFARTYAATSLRSSSFSPFPALVLQSSRPSGRYLRIVARARYRALFADESVSSRVSAVWCAG